MHPTQSPAPSPALARRYAEFEKLCATLHAYTQGVLVEYATKMVRDNTPRRQAVLLDRVNAAMRDAERLLGRLPTA